MLKHSVLTKLRYHFDCIDAHVELLGRCLIAINKIIM